MPTQVPRGAQRLWHLHLVPAPRRGAQSDESRALLPPLYASTCQQVHTPYTGWDMGWPARGAGVRSVSVAARATPEHAMLMESARAGWQFHPRCARGQGAGEVDGWAGVGTPPIVDSPTKKRFQHSAEGFTQIPHRGEGRWVWVLRVQRERYAA